MRKRLGGLRALCRARACLFIFASGLRTRHTRWTLSLSFLCARDFLSHRQQQAKKGKLKLGKETERQREKKHKRGTQEEKYGRNCRSSSSSSSSADCNASMPHKNGNAMLLCERRERKEQKRIGEILKTLINTAHLRRE